jgi:hypothetical protein
MASLTVKLSRLVNAVQSGTLAKIAGLVPPGAYHFRMAKLLDAVDAEMASFQKQQQALFKKHGVPGKGEQGQDILTMVGAKPEDLVAFNDGMGPLLDLDVLIPYEPIIWEKLGADAHKVLTIQDVRTLGPLLVETQTDVVP